MIPFEPLNKHSISMPSVHALFAPVVLFVATCCVTSAQAGSTPEDGSGKSVRAVRSIDDSHSGVHWLLVRDPRHPAGPGRLVNLASEQGNGTASISHEHEALAYRDLRLPLPVVIRAGDPLIVEDVAGCASARLEAVALGPATVGSEFRVRLRIGGAVIKVVAVAQGHAKIADRIEVRQ